MLPSLLFTDSLCLSAIPGRCSHLCPSTSSGAHLCPSTSSGAHHAVGRQSSQRLHARGRCADCAAGVLSLAAGPRPCDCERSWAACVRLSTRQVLDLAASVSTFTLGAHSSDPWPLYPCINAEQVSWSGSTTGTRALQQDLAEGG